MRTHEYTTETEARSAWHRFCAAYGIENCQIRYQPGLYTINVDEAGDLTRVAKNLGVDAGALRSLLDFLRAHMSELPGGMDALSSASPAQQDAILRAGVTAWHTQGQKVFADLLDGSSDWAQAARAQIADDVWHSCRVMHGAAQ